MRLILGAFVRLLAVCLCCSWVSISQAFISNGRWSSTATDPTTQPLGNPVTLTWSIVPDGTNISHLAAMKGHAVPSDLVAFLDGTFCMDACSGDFDDRPWFPLLESSFNRWSELSGMTFVYEPADDGISGTRWHGSHPGVLGVRGDVRLAGAFVDGNDGSYASAGFIPNADITFDTGDLIYYQNPENNYIRLRNTLMHEIGHSLGLDHSLATTSSVQFLMEGAPMSSFDGPQIDDIRGVQYLYGDKYEKNGGNNSLETAFDLGPVLPGAPVNFGLHSKTGTRVEAVETDFASVANSSDFDFFKFETQTPTLLDLVLTPVGPTYRERVPPAPAGNINTSLQSDLSLELFQEGNPLPIASSSIGGLGQAESLLDFELGSPGSYIARIVGNTEAIQLYTLEISVVELALEQFSGDFNGDGSVNAADYTRWRDNFGDTDDAAILDRGDRIPGIDAGDYAVWKNHFGSVYVLPGSGAVTAPEPSSFVGILIGAAALLAGAWRATRFSLLGLLPHLA